MLIALAQKTQSLTLCKQGIIFNVIVINLNSLKDAVLVKN